MANPTMANAVFEQELYAKCYQKIASKRQWRNRDFDSNFDIEVRALYDKIRKLLSVV